MRKCGPRPPPYTAAMAPLDTHALVRTWHVLPSRGYTTAWAELAAGRLRARGRAVALDPAPYWLAYEMETGPQYVTRRLSVTVETQDTTARLELRRDDGGGGRTTARPGPTSTAPSTATWACARSPTPCRCYGTASTSGPTPRRAPS